jgi:ankyrin repeat protein
VAVAIQELLSAVYRGDVKRVSALLALDPRLISATGPHPLWGGEPQALHVAAEWGRLEVLQLILARGAKINAAPASYGGWTPLQLSLIKQRAEVADELIARGALIDVWSAAALGDVMHLHLLLRGDASLATRVGPGGNRPLHFARNESTGNLLMKHGADPFVRNDADSTPARTLAYMGPRREEIARALLQRTGENDIFLRVGVGDALAVEAMLAADPSLVHAIDPYTNPAMGRGATPLHIAACTDRVKMANLLLDRGADINSVGEDGATPLHHAAYCASQAVAKVLIERGADRSARDRKHDATPRDWAEFVEHESMISVLA